MGVITSGCGTYKLGLPFHGQLLFGVFCSASVVITMNVLLAVCGVVWYEILVRQCHLFQGHLGGRGHL